MIQQRSNTKYTEISICNFSKYAARGNTSSNTSGNTSSNTLTRNKKEEKEINKEKDKKTHLEKLGYAITPELAEALT